MDLGDFSELGEDEFVQGWAWDGVKGKQLDVSKVREARSEEVGYMMRNGGLEGG